MFALFRFFVFGRRTLLLWIGTIFLIGGCQKAELQPSKPEPPEVFVAMPELKPFQEYEEFTGRVWATKTVEIKARVSGYLDEVLFQDGTDVKEDAPLFQIDPRPYQAERDRTEANVLQVQTRLARLESQLKRAESLIQKNAISQEEFESTTFDRDEAKAALKSAIASRDTAELNLKFTRVTAPINGRISRHMVDPGSLVKADETLLTNIVSLNPIDVYFDMDERTVLKLRRMSAGQNGPEMQVSSIEIQMSLADQNDYSLRGVIDFTDNQIETGTGTLRLRAKVKNDKQLLLPGMFVRCRYPIGKEEPALLIPEEALGSDQGVPFIYVVDDQNKVVYHRVEIGPLQGDLRVILRSLQPNERVVVTGLQRVRSGIEVKPRMKEQSTTQNQSISKKSSDPSTATQEPVKPESSTKIKDPSERREVKN